MQQRLNVITLGCRNLERTCRFYCEGLGWKPSSASKREIVFFDLGTVVLALYPRDLLADDACVEAAGRGFSGVTLAQNVHTKAEVADMLGRAEAAGAVILKPAADTFWGGYAGYFADPEGNAWEVAYNPHWVLTSDGRLELP